MEGFRYVDLFATKGIEYLLVLCFLLTFVPFWRAVRGPVRAGLRAVGRLSEALWEWFSFPKGIYYHQGHSWAMPSERGLVKVGLDDFAQRLLGRPEAVHLPAVGTKVEQGETGWKLTIDSKTIEMLSPVTGEVVAINRRVLEDPGILNRDPYGEGWLFLVKPKDIRTNIRNLLAGDMVRAWVQTTLDRLRRRMGRELGAVYQDGGIPVAGFVRALSPDRWDEIAREFLIPEAREEGGR